MVAIEELFARSPYDAELVQVLQNENCKIYQMKNSSGCGTITAYAVYPGITLLYNDMHMGSCKEYQPPSSDWMEINHCREGRFECAFRSGTFAYLGEGDLAVNMLTNKPTNTCFPLSYYHGVSVVIDLKKATESIALVSAALGGIAIDLYTIRDRLCGNDTCCIMRAEDTVQHIFSELYTAGEAVKQDYFKLKILELLLFLSTTEKPAAQTDRPYFHKNQVAIIKEIEAYITCHVDQHFTLEELSRKFHIPLTSMKLCFKGIYGSPIYTYMLSYRMQTAAQLLRQTKESVTAIGMQVGYANGSKFSEAFKKIMQLSPSVYRRKYSKPT